MWEIKLKATNMINKQRLINTDSGLVITRGKGRRGVVDRDKEGQKFSERRKHTSEHTMQCTYDVLLNCTPETYLILLTNFTLIILMKNKKKI